jgi:hypothetical protein
MRLDLKLVCRLMQHHLDEEGTSATVVGSELRVDGLSLRFRSAGVDDDEAPASLFWVDIDGLGLRPQMQLDLSGWGTSTEDAAMDAAHGMLESILPPLRWLAREPWEAPDPDVGTIHRFVGEGEAPWTAVLGRPWVVVVATDGALDVNAAGDRIREGVVARAADEFRDLGTWPVELSAMPRGHWFKVYVARMADGQVDGRVDVDNDASVEAEAFAGTFPWQDDGTLQIVRQLIVMRPDGEPPRPESPGRIARLLRRG